MVILRVLCISRDLTACSQALQSARSCFTVQEVVVGRWAGLSD